APRAILQCLAEWERDHARLHGYAAMRRELDRRVSRLFFAPAPYLYEEIKGVGGAGEEHDLIEARGISGARIPVRRRTRALCLRLPAVRPTVGISPRRPRPALPRSHRWHRVRSAAARLDWYPLVADQNPRLHASIAAAGVRRSRLARADR